MAQGIMRDCIAKGILTDAIGNTNKLSVTGDVYRLFGNRNYLQTV